MAKPAMFGKPENSWSSWFLQWFRAASPFVGDEFQNIGRTNVIARAKAKNIGKTNDFYF